MPMGLEFKGMSEESDCRFYGTYGEIEMEYSNKFLELAEEKKRLSWYEYIPEQKKVVIFGIVSNGIPIWGDASKVKNLEQASKRKISQYIKIWEKYILNKPAQFCARYDIFNTFTEEWLSGEEDVDCEPVKTFFEWKSSENKNLAFIYQGIFFFRRPKETMEECAKRFFEEHPQWQKEVQHEIEKKAWKEEYGIKNPYTRAIFADGALLFYRNNIIRKFDERHLGVQSSNWLWIAMDGYFPNIKKIIVAEEEILKKIV